MEGDSSCIVHAELLVRPLCCFLKNDRTRRIGTLWENFDDVTLFPSLWCLHEIYNVPSLVRNLGEHEITRRYICLWNSGGGAHSETIS